MPFRFTQLLGVCVYECVSSRKCRSRFAIFLLLYYSCEILPFFCSFCLLLTRSVQFDLAGDFSAVRRIFRFKGGFGYFAWIKLDITSEIDSEIFEASIDTLLMMISGVAPGSSRVQIRTEHKDQASRRKLCRVICHSSFPFSFPVCH